MIYLANCFYFVSVISTFDTTSCILSKCIIAVALFVLCKCFNYLIPWVKVWYLLFVWIIINMGKSIRDENPEAVNKQNNILRQHDHFAELFKRFDFEWIFSHTHNWLANWPLLLFSQVKINEIMIICFNFLTN